PPGVGVPLPQLGPDRIVRLRRVRHRRAGAARPRPAAGSLAAAQRPARPAAVAGGRQSVTPRATLGRRLSQRLRSLHAAVTALPALAPLMVALFTVAYFAATCDLASLKPFSFDELTTYNIARSPSAGTLWANWLASGDGVPPVAHLATHIAGSALGFSHVTARLPDMIGFWVMSVCVFSFLRRRVGALLAVLGMLIPVTVPMAYGYAYEVRGYGIVLAFSAAAVVGWDLTRDERWRPLALLGMPICIAAAVATHLYAIL